MEYLACVDAVLQCNPSHGSTCFQRLLHNTPTFSRTTTPTRPRSQPTTQIYVNHPHIITAQHHSVYPANTGRLRTINSSVALSTTPSSVTHVGVLATLLPFSFFFALIIFAI